MKNILLIIFILDLFTTTGHSQTIIKPNFALKSHETLEISKVEITAQKTVIFLSVENLRSSGGYFCADKNIFMIYRDGTRSRLLSSKGIPVCPDSYKFKTIGERLDFQLTFPPLKNDEQWIDLIEDCSDNCFSFYGVCLNNELNKKIDEASLLAENGKPAEASADFIKIANSFDSKNSEVPGLIYLNIIKLSQETGNTTRASEWYNKLKSSAIPEGDLYIKHLNSQGIIY
jgi:hypothetical protein